ncbi:dihydroorotate dehydrogenase [Chengkuizengella axinellae]|uniref:Dihydroorotate dehydrogenase n=1 Tax=Chengkuizengella axinellae TaxID=3064388 RepID=A0ABT9J7Z1_9BACL|nr:dihydroorotate dehydrogenase [Chengkuizengella sp. 2205SS18-9]MDP5277110.1 dihydroorotate dehydrogenase [Chengkuizengella sp. 2205SS18-9]
MCKSLQVKIADVTFKNPVMNASGTFQPRECADYVDINQLGAVVVKGISSEPWTGNATPRVAETYGGMLNSVGLQNPGVDVFLQEELPYLEQFDTKIIVNIAGRTIEEYCEVAEKLQGTSVEMLELNISCPNVKEGGVAFGTDAKMVEKITGQVKRHTDKPLIVKLSPNVTHITEMAKAAVSGGADALSLINTLLGMRIDVHHRQPILATKMGGLSGPAVKPIAVRMVYQVANAVDVPIIGMGGIQTGEDAIEFILAGADAIAVGTAGLTNPTAMTEVLQGIESYMDQYNIQDINELRGLVK